MKKYYILGIFICITLTFSQCMKNDSPVVPKSKAELGKEIFFDQHLSTPVGQSCSSCHNPNEGFSDPNHLSTSPGAVAGLFGNRNSSAITYSMYAPVLHYSADLQTYIGGLFWDGRVNTLEEQAKKPFFNPIEMNLQDATTLSSKIRSASYYNDYLSVYGAGNSDAETVLNNVADALANFERSNPFNAFTSKYDYYLAGKVSLSPDESSGLDLFTSKAKCAVCHSADPDELSNKILFTDFRYVNIGVPQNPKNNFYLLPAVDNPLGEKYVDFGLGTTINNVAANGGQFRVPTLRNVELTAPYFHNGVFNTLEEVVHFYNTRDIAGVSPEVDINVDHKTAGDLRLTPAEENQLVAFLKTLTDNYSLH